MPGKEQVGGRVKGKRFLYLGRHPWENCQLASPTQRVNKITIHPKMTDIFVFFSGSTTTLTKNLPDYPTNSRVLLKNLDAHRFPLPFLNWLSKS